MSIRDDLVSEAEHARRVAQRAAREALLRPHVKCRRCRKPIPETKRSVAVYCCYACKRAYRFERKDDLVKELRRMVRALKGAERCVECAAPLDTRVRPGPPPARCPRCRGRLAKRAYRKKKKEETS